MTDSRQVAGAIWSTLGLNESALVRLTLDDAEPLFPSSFRTAVAAQVSIGCAALAATEFGRLRGLAPAAVEVETGAAERECLGYYELDGKPPVTWAPLSGVYSCADGYVRVHANFDHHRDAALRAVGLESTALRETLAERLMAWPRVDFETAALAEGGAVSACRSFEEWDRTPQAGVVRGLPLLSLDRIDESAPRTVTETAASPLAGVRVLDLTRILAGPICGRTLAAYGADVMLVNSPALPNIEHIVETSRGKLSCHIDLETSDGREALHHLLADADVFVQGYRPGALEALGFSPGALAERYPGLVYVSLSAYGAGPWQARRGFDSLVQTATGFNLAEAEAAGSDKPRGLPFQILDCASGYLMASAAIAGLIRQREQGGSWHGQVSLVQTAEWLRGLGRREADFDAPTPDLRAALENYPCDKGELRAVPHAARIDGRICDWVRPSVVPGAHEPRWPND